MNIHVNLNSLPDRNLQQELMMFPKYTFGLIWKCLENQWLFGCQYDGFINICTKLHFLQILFLTFSSII